ncbi:unnamed protein product [Phaedon cochleariae]|uniref:DDE-1 domain-containing protein n=1 Tax=Phaedon cochleariae TaxID=80249 RepID=A0A9N9SJR2_PHACE|nr:unnamed protein product [Phaedon cochleariae]
MAKKEQVEIIKLPPHSSHLLQPLDLSVFKPLKTYWDQALVKWQRQHIGKKLPKSEFSKIVGKLWLETKIETICNGFKKGGIYPFNDKIIPNEKYDPILLQKWQSLNLPEHADNGSNQQDQTLPDPTTSISISSASAQVLPQYTACTSSDVHQARSEPTVGTNSEKVRFEELLISTIKQSQSEAPKKKRKVATGAEVVTGEEVLQRMKEEEMAKSTVKKVKKNKRIRKEPSIDDMISEESDAELSLHDSEDDVNESLLTMVGREQDDEADMDEFNTDAIDMVILSWVLVKFPTKKTIRHFVGQIIEMVENEPVVKFARKINKVKLTRKTVFVFPDIEDSSLISEENIIRVLPTPLYGRRGEIEFPVDFSNYNV